MIKAITEYFKYIPEQIKVLASGYISVLTLFFIWRFVFTLYFLDDLQIENFFLYLQSFLIAIKLDLVVTAYLLFPITMTIFFPYIGWYNKYYRLLMYLYIGFVFIFTSILCSMNLEWFNENGNHINMLMFMYGERPEGIKFIWENFPIIAYVFSWTIAVYISYKLMQTMIEKLIENTIRKVILEISGFIFAFIISIIFARGGFQEKPVDWGYAHFSNNNMANTIAQNPIFFLGRSVLEYKSEEHFAKEMLSVEKKEAMKNYKLLKANSNKEKLPIKINLTDQKPNIIILVLESFVAKNCNFLNPNLTENITPFLSTLANNSLNFSNCYANGIRSAYGIGTILSGWPVMPGKPIITQVETTFKDNKGTESLRMLAELGYNKSFMCGCDANFDNMSGFVKANGFNDVIDWSDGFLANINDGTVWGKFDHYLLDRLLNVASKQDSAFFITAFTTTNHDPFVIPEDYKDRIPEFEGGKAKYLRAKKTMAYNDLIIKEFLEKAKLEHWYDNTIFIFTADHGLNIHKDIRNHPINGKIPFIIHSPMLESALTIDKIVSQVDIFPTILDLIGESEKAELLFGVSGLRKGEGFACRVTDDQLQWIEDEYIYTKVVGSNKNKLYQYKDIWNRPYEMVTDNPNITNQIKNKCQSYMQIAHSLFKGIY